MAQAYPLKSKTASQGGSRFPVKGHHCNHCDNVVQGKMFLDVQTNKICSIKYFINCQTTHVIYRLECPQCKVCYIERAKRWLLDWLAEHKYAIRSGNEEYPMARRFKLIHNSNPFIWAANILVTTLQGTEIEVVTECKYLGFIFDESLSFNCHLRIHSRSDGKVSV